MKITKLVKSISRTINLGDFNSIRIENGVEAEIAESDNLEQVEQKLYLDIRRAMANDIRRIKEEKRQAVQEED